MSKKNVGLAMAFAAVLLALLAGYFAFGRTTELDSATGSDMKLAVQQSGLVDLVGFEPGFVIELRYAGEANLLGKPAYPGNYAFLQQETAAKLVLANELFMQAGYRLKIWDAYRPVSVHNRLWAAAGDKNWYFADPRFGSLHSRGAAVDVTLVDALGNELLMPSDFDDFTGRGARYAEMDSVARENMLYLTEIMESCGFLGIAKEWWHFADSDWWRYPPLDIPLEAAAEYFQNN